jgi:hypothetical protein
MRAAPNGSRRNVPGHLYDLMVTVGPAADGIIASSRRRLLALIGARDADGAGREMERHVEGLRSAAIQATAMAGLIHTPVAIGPLRVNRYLNPSHPCLGRVSRCWVGRGEYLVRGAQLRPRAGPPGLAAQPLAVEQRGAFHPDA